MSAVTTAVEVPEIRMSLPMPGLDGLNRFALVRLDDEGQLFSLRSLDDERVRLIVATPALCAPEYAPVLDDETCAVLQLKTPDDAVVLLVVTAGESLRDSTVNLLAPVVVNVHTGAAAQVVLNGSDHALRAPLIPAA